jgi:hypothetical protein
MIIAEEQMMKSPTFDLSHIVIRKYRHLGEDIGVSEAKRFTAELAAAIQSIMATKPEFGGTALCTSLSNVSLHLRFHLKSEPL